MNRNCAEPRFLLDVALLIKIPSTGIPDPLRYHAGKISIKTALLLPRTHNYNVLLQHAKPTFTSNIQLPPISKNYLVECSSAHPEH